MCPLNCIFWFNFNQRVQFMCFLADLKCEPNAQPSEHPYLTLQRSNLIQSYLNSKINVAVFLTHVLFFFFFNQDMTVSRVI